MTDTQPPEASSAPGPSGPEPRNPEARPAEPRETARTAIFAAFLAGSIFAFAAYGALWGLAVVIGIVVMIFFHELGHYLTAKWSGMKVTEFFIGFGPRLWSFRRGEVEYGVKAIPAGAYVRIIGMSNLEDDIDPADEPRTYRSKSYPRRLSVAVAGSVMHFLMAFVMLFWLISAYGVRDTSTEQWTVNGVGQNDPAGEAGLQPGDEILEINGEASGTFEEFAAVLHANPGKRVDLLVRRGEETLTVSPVLARENPASGERLGYLGISPDFTVELGLAASLKETFSDYGLVAKESVLGLGRFFDPRNIGDYFSNFAPADADPDGEALDDGENRLLSPVGAVRIATELTESTGFQGFLIFFVQINIFVGIFNMVPLLPLDGGHVVVATYERAREAITGRRHRVDMKRLIPVTYAVFMVLVVLGLSALYLDLTSPLSLR